jgi:predicted RNA-binding protein with PUA-like domain
MAYWLLKTEPSTYSFEDLVVEQQTRWDGITNPAALQHLRNAAVGDRVLIYHTGGEKAAVGEAEVVEPAYADPKNPKLAVIDLRAGKALPQPVTLAQLKEDPAFADSPLVRQGRLSFVPLTAAQWKRVQALAKAKAKAG